MEVKLKYFVILTLDTYKNDYPWSIKSIKPKIVKYPKFWVTEKTPEDDFVLAHRKYCGHLSPQEAQEFLREEFDNAEETMGSISEYGLLPAISFNDDYQSYRKNAYVSIVLDYKDEELLCNAVEKHPQSEEIKEQVRNMMDDAYDKLHKVLEDVSLVEAFTVDVNQLYLFEGEGNDLLQSGS